MTAPRPGELITESGYRPRFGVGTLAVDTCNFCRASFTVPTPASQVNNVRLGLYGNGILTPHAVWCKVR